MQFFANKYDLDYYSNIPEQLCYCEYLASASDMYLQGFWSPNSTPYTLGAAVWSVDGNTALENIDPAYYEFYIAVDPFSKRHYFTWRLKSFTPLMCDTKCFLIRIGVQNPSGTYVFAAWTQRYCIPSCCEHISGVYVNEDGYVVSTSSEPSSGTIGQPTGACGRPLIRLISTSDCSNYFSGEYFGQPNTIIQGSYFPYLVISTMEGFVHQRPREITIERSYNCKVQRIESARQYLLSGSEYFPPWKMDEIESQLSSNHVYVDDFTELVEYKYYGGTAFKRYDTRECYDVFKLSATISECIVRQIFGCVSTCVEGAGAYYFIIPNTYADGLFYDNQGNIIASYIDGSGSSLINWFVAQGLDASIVSLSVVPCSYTAIISVTGDIVPSSIYYDAPTYSNQIQALFLTSTDNICDYIPTSQCDPPILPLGTFGDMPCDAPILPLGSFGDVIGDNVDIFAESPWVLNSSSGAAYNNSVEWSLDASKPVVALAGDLYMFSNELVGIVSANGVPSVPRVIDAITTNFPNGVSIMVDNYGRIYFSGEMVIPALNTATVDFVNLLYQIV